jgi:hypothetical protein
MRLFLLTFHILISNSGAETWHLGLMIQVCCTTGLAIRRTQVDEIAVSSRLSRRALIINQTHHRFPYWTNKPMTRLQTLHCAYSVENRLLKKTENSTKSKEPNAFKMWKTQQDRMLLHAIHADKVWHINVTVCQVWQIFKVVWVFF